MHNLRRQDISVLTLPGDGVAPNMRTSPRVEQWPVQCKYVICIVVPTHKSVYFLNGTYDTTEMRNMVSDFNRYSDFDIRFNHYQHDSFEVKNVTLPYDVFSRCLERLDWKLRHIFLRLRRIPSLLCCYVLPYTLHQSVGEVAQ